MMRRPSIVLIVALMGIIFASGCLSTVSLAQTVVPLATIQKGSYSGIREPLQIVIRDQQEWVVLWTRHSSIQTNPPPPPKIDFSVEMVAGVFLGEKTTGGYAVEIIRGELVESNIYFFYRETSPPPDAMVAQVLTQPHHLVKLPKYDASPIFSRENP